MKRWPAGNSTASSMGTAKSAMPTRPPVAAAGHRQAHEQWSACFSVETLRYRVPRTGSAAEERFTRARPSKSESAGQQRKARCAYPHTDRGEGKHAETRT